MQVYNWVKFRFIATGEITDLYRSDTQAYLNMMGSPQFEVDTSFDSPPAPWDATIPLWPNGVKPVAEFNPVPPGGNPPQQPIIWPGNDPIGFIVEGWAGLGIYRDLFRMTLLGSNESIAYGSDKALWKPWYRTPASWSADYRGPTTGNPTRFPIVNGKPSGVPRSDETRGYFDCDNLGWFAGGEQKDIDAFYAACDGLPPPPVPPEEIPPFDDTDTECGFYDCPSKSGGQCCHDTRPALKAISDAIKELGDKLTAKTKTSCDLTDSCVDEITKKVLKKLSEVKRTCKQCCDDIRKGVAISSENAFACAQMNCSCAEQECQIGSQPAPDGSTCQNCNKSPCCCKNGSCLPCDEPKEGRWYAWCNQETGLASVEQEGIRPTPNWISLGDYATKDAAQQAAIDGCKKQPNQYDGRLPEVSPQQPTATANSICDIAAYASPGGIGQIVGQFANEQTSVFASDIVLQTMQSLDTSTSWIPGLGPVVGALRAAVMSKPRLAVAFAPQIIGLMGCEDTEARLAVGAIGSAATVTEYTGVNVLEFAPQLSYALHASCRNKQLSPSEAVAVWLSGGLGDKDLDTHWAIDGYCEDALTRYKHAARTKLGAIELNTLRHRDAIGESEYHARMRQLGYIDQKERDESYLLSNQVPVPSDLIRMMVRDADDNVIAELFGTDSQFDAKYGDQLKRWSDDQGMPRKYMQYLWRSHWSIPAPGQLFTMYQRLRHDPKWGGADKVLSDVKAALVQQDILPYWQDKLLAIAFRPLGKVDVRRAFGIGAIDEDGVRASYWDQGYDDKNADTLTKFAVKLRDQGAVNHASIKLWLKFGLNRGEAEQEMADDGYPVKVVQDAFKKSSQQFAGSWPIKAFINGDMRSSEVRTTLSDHGVDANAIESILSAASYTVRRSDSVIKYATGQIDFDTAVGQMTDYGIAEGRSKRLLDATDAKLDATLAVQCQNAIKGRFLTGEIDGTTAKEHLIANDTVKDRAEKLVSAWGCEKSAIGKAVPAATLCDWLSNGVIDPLNFVKRLTNIGYNPKDAANLLTDCKGRINQRQVAEAMKQAKSEAAAVERQRKQAEKMQAQLDREAANIARAGKAARDTRLRRTKQLAKATEKLYKKGEADLATVSEIINSTNERLRTDYALTADESIQALLLASETYKPGDGPSWEETVNGFSQAIVDKALERDETYFAG